MNISKQHIYMIVAITALVIQALQLRQLTILNSNQQQIIHRQYRIFETVERIMFDQDDVIKSNKEIVNAIKNIK